MVTFKDCLARVEPKEVIQWIMNPVQDILVQAMNEMEDDEGGPAGMALQAILDECWNHLIDRVGEDDAHRLVELYGEA